MAGALTIRELITRYTFKTDAKPIHTLDRAVAGLKRRISGMDQRIIGVFKGIAKGIAVGAAGAAVGLGGLVLKTASAADNIAKTAKRLNVSTDFLQGMKHAAELSGSSMEELAVGLKRVSAAAYDAKQGSKESVDAFRQVGVTVTDSSGNLKTAEQLTWELFQGLSQLKDSTLQAALAQKLFGRGGLAMLPMLKDGAVGVGKMAAEARRLGLVLDKDALQGAEDFEDQMLRVKGAIGGTVARIATGLMPVITAWLKDAEKSLLAAQQWAKAHEGLIKEKVISAFKTLAKVARGLGRAIQWVADHWETVVTVLGTLIAARVLFGLVRITKGLWDVASALGSVLKNGTGAAQAVGSVGSSASGAAAGGVTRLIGKLGALAIAFTAGWEAGKKLDQWLGLSDKIAKGAEQVTRPITEATNRVYQQTEAYQRLAEQAKVYKDLAAKGVKSVTTAGGGRMELTKENVQAKLSQLAGQLGLSKDVNANLLPNLVQGLPRGPEAGAAKTAPRTGPITVQTNVNVPPGTPAAQARNVAAAASDATTRSVRNAMGDVQ